ncbi:hypothetical protein [Nonomuraea sp. B19D2]
MLRRQADENVLLPERARRLVLLRLPNRLLGLRNRLLTNQADA